MADSASGKMGQTISEDAVYVKVPSEPSRAVSSPPVSPAARPPVHPPSNSCQTSSTQSIFPPALQASRQTSSSVKTQFTKSGPDVIIKHEKKESVSVAGSQLSSASKPGHKANKSSINNEEDISKRRIVFNELVTTERTYVKCLQCMVQTYMEPLRESGIVKENRVREIFSICPNLLTFHTQFLADLEKQLASWSKMTGVGDCFINMVPFLKM